MEVNQLPAEPSFKYASDIDWPRNGRHVEDIHGALLSAIYNNVHGFLAYKIKCEMNPLLEGTCSNSKSWFSHFFFQFYSVNSSVPASHLS